MQYLVDNFLDRGIILVYYMGESMDISMNGNYLRTGAIITLVCIILAAAAAIADRKFLEVGLKEALILALFFLMSSGVVINGWPIFAGGIPIGLVYLTFCKSEHRLSEWVVLPMLFGMSALMLVFMYPLVAVIVLAILLVLAVLAVVKARSKITKFVVNLRRLRNPNTTKIA